MAESINASSLFTAAAQCEDKENRIDFQFRPLSRSTTASADP
jgi:hypothetical protein